MTMWRDISGYPGYQVSNDGNVRTLTRRVQKGAAMVTKYGRMLPQRANRGGYLAVKLSRNGKRKTRVVHRLVIEAFGPPQPSPTHECNHKDLDKTNNRIENLEWVTRSENLSHMYRNRSVRRPNRSGSQHPLAKLSDEDVQRIRSMYRPGVTTHQQLAAQFGVSRAHIGFILSGRFWNKEAA